MSPRQRNPILAALAGILLMGMGCSESESTAPKVSGEDVKQEVKEAAGTAAAYTEEQMKAFSGEVETWLQAADRKLQDLQDKAGDLQGEARQAMDRQIQNLREQRQKVANDLAELRSASGDAWKDLRAGLQSAMEDLDRAIEKAGAELRS